MQNYSMFSLLRCFVTVFRFREFLVIGGYHPGSFLLCFISLNLIGRDKLSLARLRYFSFSLLETHRSVFSTLPPLSALSRFKKYKKSLKKNFKLFLSKFFGIIREILEKKLLAYPARIRSDFNQKRENDKLSPTLHGIIAMQFDNVG